eukprot:1436417-Heterocapsa_arctica.AAC.1
MRARGSQSRSRKPDSVEHWTACTSPPCLSVALGSTRSTHALARNTHDVASDVASVFCYAGTQAGSPDRTH